MSDRRFWTMEERQWLKKTGRLFSSRHTEVWNLTRQLLRVGALLCLKSIQTKVWVCLRAAQYFLLIWQKEQQPENMSVHKTWLQEIRIQFRKPSSSWSSAACSSAHTFSSWLLSFWRNQQWPSVIWRYISHVWSPSLSPGERYSHFPFRLLWRLVLFVVLIRPFNPPSPARREGRAVVVSCVFVQVLWGFYGSFLWNCWGL